MPSPTGFPITLQDTKRILRFSTRALVRFEQESGHTIAQGAAMLQLGSLDVTCQLLWAGLLHEDPKLTIDAVYDLVELDQLKSVSEQLAAATMDALGVEDEPEEPDGEEPEGNAEEEQTA